MSKKTIKAFKGFDSDLKCRGYQYEAGKEYEHKGNVEPCESGFHACPSPLNVFDYYPPSNGSRYATVEQSGSVKEHDDKVASSKIKIGAEINLGDLARAHIDFVVSKCKKSKTKTSTKDYSAASNTGNQSAASNTGDYSAASNTGNQSAASNTGYRSAASNTGDWSAASNTGDWSAASNTGNWSAASNTGDWSAASNTGYQSAASNTGYRSAASNTGDYSAASVSGSHSVAISTGYKSKAMASEGSWIVLTERNEEGEILSIKTAKAGDQVKPETWYQLVNGEFVEAA